jgi:hypothetical protein
MSKSPPVPNEQRSFQDGKGNAASSDHRERRDERTEVQSSDPGDADVNLTQQGRYGNIIQNTTHQGHQQDR